MLLFKFIMVDTLTDNESYVMVSAENFDNAVAIARSTSDNREPDLNDVRVVDTEANTEVRYESYLEMLKAVPKKRKTAAEKRADVNQEYTAHRIKQWAEFTAAYPAKFANLMFEYATLSYAGFRMHKLDDDTYTFSRDEYSSAEYTLKVTPPAEYSWDFEYEFDQAYALLADYVAEQAEQERKRQLRVNALNKLTAEERETLGL